MAAHLDLSSCTATFRSEAHHEHPRRLSYLTGVLAHPSPSIGDLATVRCLKVTGRIWFKNNRDFLEVMDEESREMNEFSVGLFDAEGNIRSWLVDGGPRSGSGCWGVELSVGDMVYVEDLEVKEEFRKQGVGSWLLRKLLTEDHIGYKGHAYVWPTPNARIEDKLEWFRQRDAIVAFYRKNGFRRVGLTPFFAYSPDPSHPSRNLSAAADPDPPSKAFESATATAPQLTEEEETAQYPLHFAVTSNKTPSVAQLIHAAYQADRTSIRKRDPRTGLLPIHVAAASENVHAVRALLALYTADSSGMNVKEDLGDRNNKDGMTPLESLESSMRSGREFMETLVGRWEGYSDEGLGCEWALRGAVGARLLGGVDTEDEYVKKRKWGCTCGMCAEGWLSPRMRFRLRVQAAQQYDMLRDDVDAFKSPRPVSYSDLMHSAFEYIPPAIRREICKTFYVGVYTIFDAIRLVPHPPHPPHPPQQDLHPITPPIPFPPIPFPSFFGPSWTSSTAPTGLLLPSSPSTSTSTSTSTPIIPFRSFFALLLNPRAVSFYLEKGGRVEYILDATLGMAREQSVLGDGTFEGAFGV
ncbi:hypothetical protein CPB84DRAFT_1828452 [Gymnopilus junonius]|uniref:N-acetyltransferase domain-containing protein n=1 Tax=Gymnopilus junonius TaxID=109634 RepID=A0A9P5TIH3_GYMJU|nr:hypothetical protein CPB84DRAFT_1828452 [Gymnopilus junonius]